MKSESATIVVGNETLSLSDLAAEISGAKQNILKIVSSVEQGTYVPILVDNSMSSHLAILAAAEIGLDVAIIDSNTTSEVLNRILEKLNSSVGIIANPQIIVPASPTITRFTTIQRESEEENLRHTEQTLGGSVIVFSSGSTGDPKGVILPWENLIRWAKIKIRYRSDGNSKQTQRTVLNFSPISWVLGLLNLLSVLLGAKLVTLNPNQFTPNQLLLEIQKLQPSHVTMTTNFAKVLSKAAKEWKSGPIESIQEVMIGSGKVMWETVNLFSKIIPKTAIFTHNLSATEAFRMFELNIAFGEIPTSGQVPLGAPRVAENVRLQPTDNKNKYEIFTSGDIAVGYVNEKKSKEAFSVDNQGKIWWKSGELVSLDIATGDYYHAGRIDNLIKINDHNVQLDEIEGLFQSHSAVSMATVFPVEIEERTRLVAFISWNDGNSLSQHEIAEYLSGSLPKYALPHKIVSLTSFPLTRSGKIDRAALAKIVAD